MKQVDTQVNFAGQSFSEDALGILKLKPRALPKQRRSLNYCGWSAIEALPLELLSRVADLLMEVSQNSVKKRNADLLSLLLTSKRLYGVTLLSLYRRITIPHSRIFKTFFFQIASNPHFGTLIRRIDFGPFNPTALFETASDRSQARNLTPDTLHRALELMPYLEEFLAQEYVEDELDARVIDKLFFGLERMQALDFCGCSSSSFRDAFANVFANLVYVPYGINSFRIQRLSLHMCTTLPATIFEGLLPRLTQLTHLDVAGTKITDEALASLPCSARITQLNLAKCRILSAAAITRFISTHPAVTESLVWLSLATDARTHETFNANSLTSLIPLLPSSLRSLSLKGSRMDPSHICLLRPLTKHLEELALGRGLGVNDTNGLFVRPEICGVRDSDRAIVESRESREKRKLRCLDLSDMWHGDLDLMDLYNLSECALLTRHTAPLEALEVPEDVARRLEKNHKPLTRLGWGISTLGSRSWIVRESGSAADASGSKAWKIGVKNWGMRKIHVAGAEGRGMYNSYMFARRL